MLYITYNLQYVIYSPIIFWVYVKIDIYIYIHAFFKKYRICNLYHISV